MDADEAAQALEVHIRQTYLEGIPGRNTDIETCVVKKGPQVYKTAELLTFSNDTGDVRKRELRMQSWRKGPSGSYNFDQTDNRWHCEGLEIDALRAFLDDKFRTAGKYKIVRSGSDFAALLDQVQNNEIAPGDLAHLVRLAAALPNFVETLAASDHGRLLAEGLQLHQRRQALAELRQIIEDDSKNEQDIHRKLKTMTWVFGGRYVGEAIRKQLTSEDILDIPLIRADGSLHIVELKQAAIPRLFIKPRKHVMVGNPVHEAVGQAMNYLRALDEERNTILAKYGVDCRRSSATVVIGHPAFNGDTTDRHEMAEALRTYNAITSRIEVITYADLLDDAQRAHEFSAATTSTAVANVEDDPLWPPEPDPTPWDEEPPF